MTKQWIPLQQPFSSKTTICLSWPKGCSKTSSCNKKRATKQIKTRCKWWSSSMNSSYNNFKVKYRHLCTKTSKWKTVPYSKRSHFTNTNSKSSSYRIKSSRTKLIMMWSLLKYVRLIIMSRPPFLRNLMKQNKRWSILNLKPNKCQSLYNSKTKKWPHSSIIVLSRSSKFRSCAPIIKTCLSIWRL